MKKTTVYLPEALQRALEEAARTEKKPQAELMRAALEEYLERRERPSLRSLGLGEDERAFGCGFRGVDRVAVGEGLITLKTKITSGARRPSWEIGDRTSYRFSTKIAYPVERRLGALVPNRFLADLESGEFTLDCGEEDLGRVREPVVRYADMPLGFADASVTACAVRNGGRVLTLDLRRFGTVAAEGKLSLLP